MRCLALALGLICAALASKAQPIEIEDQRLYPGTGAQVVRVISTADLDVFDPFLLRFQRQNPQIGIDYTVVSSSDLHRALSHGAVYDLALSSAMDLQFKLANDGFAQGYSSAQTEALPDWAQWRNQIFAFTAEPAVIVLSRARFNGLPVPQTRQDLIDLLRDNPERFAASVGTYDIRDSGLGYLFATQEARSSDAYWRLTEVMGRLDPQLYCCSAQMIDDVASGRLALAYNVLGSYAAERLASGAEEGLQILQMEDFANVMLRTALIPATATEVEAAGAMLDALLAEGMGSTRASTSLPPLRPPQDAQPQAFGPIRLGPGLLVYLDRLNRQTFVEQWENAMEQR